MLKFIGILIIVGVCGYFGWLKQRQLYNRAEQLEQMIFSVESIASELDYGKEPMNTVLRKICGENHGGVYGFYNAVSEDLNRTNGKTLGEIWRNRLYVLAEKTDFTKEDLRIILEYGSGLGITHTEDQLKKLAFFSLKLKQQHKSANADYHRLGKVFRVSGWCAGIVLALLLF